MIAAGCPAVATDPPRDGTDFPVVTSVPSLGEKLGFCTLGGNKQFRVRLDLEGYSLAKLHLVLGWAEKEPSCSWHPGESHGLLCTYEKVQENGNFSWEQLRSPVLAAPVAHIPTGAYQQCLLWTLWPDLFPLQCRSIPSNHRTSYSNKQVFICLFWLLSSYFPGFVPWTGYRNFLSFLEKTEIICALLKILKSSHPRYCATATCCLTQPKPTDYYNVLKLPSIKNVWTLSVCKLHKAHDPCFPLKPPSFFPLSLLFPYQLSKSSFSVFSQPLMALLSSSSVICVWIWKHFSGRLTHPSFR